MLYTSLHANATRIEIFYFQLLLLLLLLFMNILFCFYDILQVKMIYKIEYVCVYVRIHYILLLNDRAVLSV